jgi:hypothetical protein
LLSLTITSFCHYGQRYLGATKKRVFQQPARPEERERKFKEHIGRKKQFKVSRYEKGESTIRDGFNKIYRAIKRKPAPTQEDAIPTPEQYNCPDHGMDCPQGCAYLDRWYANFVKKNRMPSLKEQLGYRYKPSE